MLQCVLAVVSKHESCSQELLGVLLTEMRSMPLCMWMVHGWMHVGIPIHQVQGGTVCGSVGASSAGECVYEAPQIAPLANGPPARH
jgi:hypothetical protein